MATRLDYAASVPVDVRAPFSVNVDPNKPPGKRFNDYIPKHLSDVVVTKQDDTIRKKNFMRPPVARYDTDYRSGADSAALRKTEKVKILEMAKQMMEDEKNRREVYLAAEKRIKEATPEELQEPSPELAKAQKIVARTKPLTKEQALEKATKQFYGMLH